MKDSVGDCHGGRCPPRNDKAKAGGHLDPPLVSVEGEVFSPGGQARLNDHLNDVVYGMDC